MTDKEKADALRKQADELEAGHPPVPRKLIEDFALNIALLAIRASEAEGRLDVLEAKTR
jgi:hypothetical protein